MSHLLPSAFSKDKSHLSEGARREIRALLGARPMAFLGQAVGAWTVILAAIAIASRMNSVWVTLLAMILIATRLNILALLVHEQVHSLGFRGRFGDLIVNLIAAYPMGASVEGYANVHLAHHKFYFTDRDPDVRRKSGPEWTFPMPTSRLIGLFLRDLSGLSAIHMVRGKLGTNGPKFKRNHPTPGWVRIANYAFIILVLAVTGSWLGFLLFWVVPLLMLFPVILRFGAICEHVYVQGASLTETTPLIIPKWWEALLLPNLNFTLHSYHHFYPGIAFPNLPEVHAIFEREGLMDKNRVFHGYWAYFRHLQRLDTTTNTDTESVYEYR